MNVGRIVVIASAAIVLAAMSIHCVLRAGRKTELSTEEPQHELRLVRSAILYSETSTERQPISEPERAGQVSRAPDHREGENDHQAGDVVVERKDSEDSGAILETGRRVDGKRNGVWQVFEPGGRLWIEKTYYLGQLNGMVTAWGSDGRKQSENEYRDGMLNGKSVGWFSNGQQAYVYEYRNNMRNGPWMEWYANGHTRSEGASIDDKLEGCCKYFLENDSLDELRSGFYRTGVLVTPCD